MATVVSNTRVRARTRDSACSVPPVSTQPGRIVRLSDPEMRGAVQAVVDDLTSDPVKAQAWLQELGYLTASGNVTRRYGGR